MTDILENGQYKKASSGDGTVASPFIPTIAGAVTGMPASVGQKAMAASLPVAIASDQSAVKVESNISTPTVYNVTLTNADTEYNQAMPANCRGFEFICRTAFDVRFAFVTGKVATPTAPYITLKSGSSYSSPALAQGASPSTLYFASSQAGVVVAIIAWS